jgi:predicted peptidase
MDYNMKIKYLLLATWLLTQSFVVLGQKPNPYVNVFPKGTVIHDNVPYNNDADPRHLLDLYLPANPTGKVPLVIFVHGGGWISNDKYADMGYMERKTISFPTSNLNYSMPGLI